MSLTFEEIVERLKHFDEVTLLELFNLSSEELVEMMRDTVEDNIEFYYEQVKTETDSDPQGTEN